MKSTVQEFDPRFQYIDLETGKIKWKLEFFERQKLANQIIKNNKWSKQMFWGVVQHGLSVLRVMLMQSQIKEVEKKSPCCGASVDEDWVEEGWDGDRLVTTNLYECSKCNQIINE